jgi:hypothetical protein
VNLEVRKTVVQIEDVLSEGGRPLERPVRRVVAAAVVRNPYVDEYVEELTLLMEAGAHFGHVLMERAMSLLERPVEAYGKGGIVGERGEVEHVAAVLHPQFGAPTRGLSGGVSILPSVKKRGPAGASIDIPVHHKRAMLIRSHFDSIEFRIPDAPASDELVVALAVTDGGRPHPRVGGLQEEDAIGQDGLR